jgi:hypothetical protein
MESMSKAGKVGEGFQGRQNSSDPQTSGHPLWTDTVQHTWDPNVVPVLRL